MFWVCRTCGQGETAKNGFSLIVLNFTNAAGCAIIYLEHRNFYIPEIERLS